MRYSKPSEKNPEMAVRSINSTVGDGEAGLSVLLPDVQRNDMMDAQKRIRDLRMVRKIRRS